jgi:hypothetical protein
MPAAANRRVAAHADAKRAGELRGLAEELRAALPRVPSGYEPGHEALVEAIVRIADVSAKAADRIIAELEDLDLVKYDPGGRGIGAAGVWTYPRSAAARTPARRRRRAR